MLAAIQEKTAFLPDYGFQKSETKEAPGDGQEANEESWPAVSAGTSVSGLVGAAVTMALVALIGFGLTVFKQRP